MVRELGIAGGSGFQETKSPLRKDGQGALEIDTSHMVVRGPPKRAPLEMVPKRSLISP